MNEEGILKGYSWSVVSPNVFTSLCHLILLFSFACVSCHLTLISCVPAVAFWNTECMKYAFHMSMHSSFAQTCLWSKSDILCLVIEFRGHSLTYLGKHIFLENWLVHEVHREWNILKIMCNSYTNAGLREEFIACYIWESFFLLLLSFKNSISLSFT